MQTLHTQKNGLIATQANIPSEPKPIKSHNIETKIKETKVSYNCSFEDKLRSKSKQAIAQVLFLFPPPTNKIQSYLLFQSLPLIILLQRDVSSHRMRQDLPLSRLKRRQKILPITPHWSTFSPRSTLPPTNLLTQRSTAISVRPLVRPPIHLKSHRRMKLINFLIQVFLRREWIWSKRPSQRNM